MTGGFDVQWSFSMAHRILGIESPSRVWFTQTRSEKYRPPEPPAPWYSVRGSRDPYEYPELARAARSVRRLIRRHWYVLLFEPDDLIALGVRIAMATPPKRPGSPSLLDTVMALEKLGLAPKPDPELMRDFAAQCGIQWDNP
jgi:hypothetical protein